MEQNIVLLGREKKILFSFIFIRNCFVFWFRQALAQGLFMNVAEYFKENDYRTVSLNRKIYF